MKREVEMGVYDDGGKARVKNHRFIKGRSLPNPSIARQYIQLIEDHENTIFGLI